jgi:hypothetical protein
MAVGRRPEGCLKADKLRSDRCCGLKRVGTLGNISGRDAGEHFKEPAGAWPDR